MVISLLRIVVGGSAGGLAGEGGDDDGGGEQVGGDEDDLGGGVGRQGDRRDARQGREHDGGPDEPAPRARPL